MKRGSSPNMLGTALCALWLVLESSAGGLSLPPPDEGSYGPPADEGQRLSPLVAGGSPVTQGPAPGSGLFRDTTIIDFEKRQVTLVRIDQLGFIIWTHHYGELNEYLAERAKAAMDDLWHENSLLAKRQGPQEKQQQIKFAWELPVQYPSWAQRVLGNEPPRLSISGYMKLRAAYEDVRRKESSAWQVAQTAPAFNFQPEYQFSVAGSIGRLINVNISANSTSDVDVNDPLKNFHIDYKESKPGELEDEIIQEVSAGYTGFSMPGTQLSGYSESHEGLFGIKVTSRVGPVTITSIASTEQGEAQKLSVSNSGAGQGSTSTIKEDRFKTNKYFFLDTAYIRHYNRKYALHGRNPGDSLPDSLVVRELQVWKSVRLDEVSGIILQDNRRRIRDFNLDMAGEEQRQFVRLERDRHYRLYEKEGWVRLTDSVTVNDADMLAIYLRAGPSGDTSRHTIAKGGDMTGTGDSIYPAWLWVLKPDQYIDSLGADPERFRLMWRNVYDMPGEVPDRTKFILRLYHTPKDGGDTQKTTNTGAYLSDVMGITRGGAPLILSTDIINFDYKEIIIPPYDTGAFGNEPFGNPALRNEKNDDLRDTLIYRYGPNSRVLSVTSGTYVPVFTLEMSGTSKQTTFDLGFGVMEKTVQVTADGRQLQPNVDYVLNTEIGRLELVSPLAKAADKIDINYQREALFMPERKLFLGTRAEMKLPFISDKSLAGLSVLWQSTSVSQIVPRINQEPYSKLLLDFNTRLDFEPAWMTGLVNALPFVTTEAPSAATLDFEIAHSRMNPNKEAEAYVDDFESSKQIYSLGEGYRNWYRASPPFPRDSLPAHPPAWDWYWFTPVYSDAENMVLRSRVWADTERIYTGMAGYETVLRLHCRPAPEDASLRGRFRSSWAGIMTPVPLNLADRKRDQYFEMLLKCQNGAAGRGRLRIQMGRMREDICVNGFPPNGAADREDTSFIWRENHDSTLDKGLDGLPNEAESYGVPNSSLTGWDSLRQNDPALGEEWSRDPAKDHYSLYDEQNPGNYRSACRYEANGWANETEDIDNNGNVEAGIAERYHEFIIDLEDTNSPYIDRSARLVRDIAGEASYPGCSWRRYRIPLHEILAGYSGIRRDTGLAPDDWHDIRMVRIIWDDFDSTRLQEDNRLVLSGMQFVGSQWEAVRDTTGATKIDVAAISTREDTMYFREVENLERQNASMIRRERDETNNYAPEQSLRLNFHNLLPGDQAIVQRSFSYQPLNVASYDSLTIVMYGRDTTEPGYLNALDRDDLKFVFRFGSDTSTYYEYRRTIRHRWDNYVCVNLRQLSDLKLAAQTRALVPGDPINEWNGDSSLHIRAPKGRQPNFANIIWMAVGVVCDSSSSAPTGYAGELWVDELKVVGIKRFNGWASRLSLQTQWADFMTLSAGLKYEGGDFRTMTDSRITMGDSRLEGSLNLSTGIEKFLPKEWGFSIPLGGSVSSSLTRPQIKPNTDIYLTDRETSKPDGFLEMIRDVAGLKSGNTTESERFETQSSSQNFFINFSKSNTSSNPAVDLLLQRLSTNFTYSRSSSHTNRGKRPDVDSLYVDSTSSKTYAGSVRYDLTPRNPPKWTKWKPLGDSAPSWVPSRLRELEFSLLPSKIDITVASANYTSSVERRFNAETNMPLKRTSDFTLNHGVQIEFSPIRPVLDLSYSLTVNRDFPNDSVLGAGGGAARFIGERMFAREADPTFRDYLILRNERSRTQQFKASLNPQLAEWLTNSADYSANYSGAVTRWGSDSSRNFINAGVNSGFNFSSSLSVDQLLRKASDSGWLGKLARGVKKGCDAVGFSNVSFTYSASADLNNKYLGADYLSGRDVGLAELAAYQLGLKGTNIITGDMDDRRTFGGMRCRSLNDDYNFYKDDSRATNRNYQVQTSLKLAAPFELTLSPISLQWSTRYSVRPDSTFYDTTRSFPEFRLGAQTPVLNKLKLLSTHVEGLNISSGFSLRRNTGSSSSTGGVTEGITYDLSPLVQVNGTLKKWPVSFNYQRTLNRDERKGVGNATATTRDGDNLDMNYEIRKKEGASTIKILKWQVPVRGRTSMGMLFSRDHSVTIMAGSRTSDESNLSLKPHLSYIFTDNVTGTFEYVYAKTTKNGSSTTSNTAGLVAEIKF